MLRILVLPSALALAALALLAFHSPAPGKGVNVHVFVPKSGDLAGVGARGFLVDLVARFKGDLASTGASPELTGPGAHANTNPFPGSFSPGANADHFPGLVTLLSSSRVGAGPGQNVSNLFNLIAITDRDEDDETDVWATWIIGEPNGFGTPGEDVETRLFVAVVDGLAPDVVVDMDSDGEFDDDDLEAMGFDVLSSPVEIEFVINGD